MDSEVKKERVGPPPLPGRLFRRFCLFTWLLPLAGVIVIVIGEAMFLASGRGTLAWALIGILLFGFGIIAGVIGLCGIDRYGKRGILWPALAEIGTSGLLLVLALPHALFVFLHNASLPPPAHLSPAVHADSLRRLKDPELQFSIDIPKGFEDWPLAKRSDPNVAHALVRRSRDRRTACVLTIERLNTQLSRTQRMTLSQLPPAARDGKIILRTWRGLDVDVISAVTTDDGGYTNYIYQCMVPLRPKAVRLYVGECGPETDPEALSQLVDTLLASLDGETNW